MTKRQATVAAAVVGCLVAMGCESPARIRSMPGWARNADEAPAVSTPGSPASARPSTRCAAPDVKAGWADDNTQYNRYLQYIDGYRGVDVLPLDVRDRITVAVRDRGGRSVPDCEVTVLDSGENALCRRRTYADGRAILFGSGLVKHAPGPMIVEAKWDGQRLVKQLDRNGLGTVEFRFDAARQAAAQVALDVAFIIDTTGSMADEIDRLRKTLDAINFQITQMKPRPAVRFAMVCYRDRGDAYITKLTQFTDDVGTFSKQLAAVRAGGGGDYAEDVQEALRVAEHDLQWRSGAVKLAFLLGDAPPHLNYGQHFTYLDFARAAGRRAIKLTAIGASGLDDRGEYIYRQLAQQTMGLFVFLTYGENRESSPDRPTGVSHHTGDNWVSMKLDAIIVQAIGRELAYLRDRPADAVGGEDYIEARSVEGLDSKAVLGTLFGDCARQLVDYSQSHLESGTSVAVVAAPAADSPAEVGRLFGDELSLAISREGCFRLVERADLKRVLDEIDLAAAFDPAGSAVSSDISGTSVPRRSAHGPSPAELLVLYRLRPAGSEYQLFVKLVRVRTGEILSASLLKIDRDLLG